MSEERSFEVESDVDPATAAAHLRAVAADLQLDRPFAVGTAERSATVAPPADEVELEIEVEREDEAVELEFELEWTPATDETPDAVADEDSEDAAPDQEADDGDAVATDEEPATDEADSAPGIE